MILLKIVLFVLNYPKIFIFIFEELQKLLPWSNQYIIILPIPILIYINFIFILNLNNSELSVFYVDRETRDILINALKTNVPCLEFHPLCN
jgi:hypothetical protein